MGFCAIIIHYSIRIYCFSASIALVRQTCGSKFYVVYFLHIGSTTCTQDDTDTADIESTT